MRMLGDDEGETANHDKTLESNLPDLNKSNFDLSGFLDDDNLPETTPVGFWSGLEKELPPISPRHKGLMQNRLRSPRTSTPRKSPRKLNVGKLTPQKLTPQQRVIPYPPPTLKETLPILPKKDIYTYADADLVALLDALDAKNKIL